MADEVREEDEWLYGEGGSDSADGARQSPGDAKRRRVDEPVEGFEEEIGGMKEEVGGAGGEDDEEDDLDEAATIARATTEPHDGESDEEDDEEEEDSDDDDDNVNVVIGDTKAAAGAGGSPFGVPVVGVKRPAPVPDKNKGKFAVEDFETPGNINGVSALEFNFDGLEDKPWRKPGADITDYFNYGFTEETWKAYSDRQKRLRAEAGGPQIVNPVMRQQDNRGVINVAFGQNQGGHMGHVQRMDGMMNRRRDEPKENTIQVMTADRREYSRKNFEMGMGGPPGPIPPFDMSIPPPNFPPPGHPGDFMPNPEYFNHPPPHYYPEDEGNYEEQEQWMDHHTDSWDMGNRGPTGPSSIVSLTKIPNVPPPPGDEDMKEDRKK